MVLKDQVLIFKGIKSNVSSPYSCRTKKKMGIEIEIEVISSTTRHTRDSFFFLMNAYLIFLKVHVFIEKY